MPKHNTARKTVADEAVTVEHWTGAPVQCAQWMVQLALDSQKELDAGARSSRSLLSRLLSLRMQASAGWLLRSADVSCRQCTTAASGPLVLLQRAMSREPCHQQLLWALHAHAEVTHQRPVAPCMRAYASIEPQCCVAARPAGACSRHGHGTSVVGHRYV